MKLTHVLSFHSIAAWLFVGTTTVFFAAVNVMKIVPYFMLAQFTAKNLATSLVLLPIAVAANFSGIWMVRTVSTEHFYRFTYILLFVLGRCCAGREQAIFCISLPESSGA